MCLQDINIFNLIKLKIFFYFILITVLFVYYSFLYYSFIFKKVIIFHLYEFHSFFLYYQIFMS